MSDKHKFRAWDETQKYMAYQGSPDLETIQSFMYHFGDKELMQFTGLHDKNGKEIYEGDIISLDKNASLYKNCPITIIGVIQFTDGKYESETKKVINKSFLNKHSIHFGVNVMDWVHLPNFKQSEIIGNIYENTELINQPIKQDGNNNK